MTGQMIGSYEVVAKVGEGGMGVVYRARDEVLHRDVALKALSDPVIERLGKEHLLHEARSSSALSHPNICTVYEIVEADGTLYIAMELVEGKPLTELIGDTGLPVESALHYGAQIAAALDAVHRAGLLHRDVKATNVLKANDGRLMLTDFGTGQPLDDSSSEWSLALAGSPLYLAPEVIDGARATVSSDIYSAGVLLFRLATGTFPVDGRTLQELREAHAARAAEGAGFWIVVRAYDPGAGPFAALFDYAASTLLGAVSMLPGGLLASEGALAALLGARGLDAAAAASATLIIRAATLWFALRLLGWAAPVAGYGRLLAGG